MRRFFWIPAFAGMTEKRFPFVMRLLERRPEFRVFVIPDLIGNPGLCLMCFLALSCVLGRALGATNEVVDALPPAAQASPIQRGEQGERDPFWPIGYVPPAKPGETVGPAKTEFVTETTSQVSNLSEMLKISGVTRIGGRFYAIINGVTVQTGEVVTAVAGGEVYKFIVEKIDFKKVQIKPLK